MQDSNGSKHVEGVIIEVRYRPGFEVVSDEHLCDYEHMREYHGWDVGSQDRTVKIESRHFDAHEADGTDDGKSVFEYPVPHTHTSWLIDYAIETARDLEDDEIAVLKRIVSALNQ